MKAKHRLDQLKKQFDRMRKDSLAAVGTANEAVYAGLHKFADKELKALSDYYDSALSSLRAAKQDRSGIKDVVQTQFDLMQQTVTRLIAHARESVEAATATASGKAAPEPAMAASAAAKSAPRKAPVKKSASPKKVAAKKSAAPTATAAVKAPAAKKASKPRASSKKASS